MERALTWEMALEAHERGVGWAKGTVELTSTPPQLPSNFDHRDGISGEIALSPGNHHRSRQEPRLEYDRASTFRDRRTRQARRRRALLVSTGTQGVRQTAGTGINA